MALPTTNLIAHYKSDAGLFTDTSATTPVASDGDAVAAWVDQVSGIKAVQSTSGARPTYKLAQVNGLPAVRFDGSADFLQFAHLTALDGASGITAFLRMMHANTGTSIHEEPLACFDTAATNQRQFRLFIGNGSDRKPWATVQRASGLSQTSGSSGLTASTWLTLSMRWDATNLRT